MLRYEPVGKDIGRVCRVLNSRRGRREFDLFFFFFFFLLNAHVVCSVDYNNTAAGGGELLDRGRLRVTCTGRGSQVHKYNAYILIRMRGV